MDRCESVYVNRDANGVALSPPRRCTREAGHPSEDVPPWDAMNMHQWMRPGHRVRWFDENEEARDGQG